jgi:hypothetical protein
MQQLRSAFDRAAAASSLAFSANLEFTLACASIRSHSLDFSENLCHTISCAAPTHGDWVMAVSSDGGPGTASVVDVHAVLASHSVDWESASSAPGFLSSP